MDLNSGPIDFSERLTRKRAELDAKKQEAEPESSLFKEDAPVLDSSRSKEETDIDRLISNIDILDAYTRWCGKMVPVAGSKREGIKVSCPNPSHPDKDPSAWVNLDKQTWFCGGCQEGGDVYDIAAWHFNFPVPGYKDGESFHRLRKSIAQDLGYIVQTTLGGSTVLVAPEEELPRSTPAAPSEPTSSVQSTVRTLSGPALEPDDPDDIVYPAIEWKKVVPEDTFLAEWMKTCTVDDLPDEYYFWLGLMGLGFAIGRDTFLADRVPVYGNLFICLIGSTGMGKSRSTAALINLLREALPYDYSAPGNKGVKITPPPGSAEALIDQFSEPVHDPADPKKIAYYAPVRGLVRFDEFASLAERANRMGSAMKPTLMEFYDANPTVELASRGSGHVICADPFCSTITTTQPGVLRLLLSRMDLASGFMNRWIFASGPPKQRFDWGGEELAIKDCVDPLRAVRAWSAGVKGINLADYPDARDVWRNFFHERLEAEQSNDESKLMTRVDLTFKKLILLLCANSRSVPTPEIVEAAISMFDYLQASYLIPAKHVRSSKTTECQDAVLGTILKHFEKNKDWPSMRDIRRSLARRNYEADFMNKVVKALIEAGEIRELTVNNTGVGRSSVKYASVI